MEQQKPYEILDHDKWQAWREGCDVRSGLTRNMCFLSGDKCRHDRCFVWRVRAMILAEGRP